MGMMVISHFKLGDLSANDSNKHLITEKLWVTIFMFRVSKNIFFP